MYLVRSGEGHLIHNYKKYELKPGWLYLIPSFTICSYSSETFLEHVYIHFIPQIAQKTDLFKLLRLKYELQADETDFLLMKRLLKLNPGRKLVNQNPDKYSKEDLIPHNQFIGSAQQIANCMETQGILLQLFSRFIEVDAQTKNPSAFNPNSKISQVIDYIQINLSKSIFNCGISRGLQLFKRNIFQGFS